MPREDPRERIRRHAEHLVQLIDDGVPKFMVALQIFQIWMAGLVWAPEELWTEWGGWIKEGVCNYHGQCTECDASVPAQLTHPVMCEQCEAKIRDEIEQIDEDLDTEDG